jgi:hypothetical protein
MWFTNANKDSRMWTSFPEDIKGEDGAAQRGSVSTTRVAFHTFALVALVCILIITLVFGAGMATGLAHSLDLSASASNAFMEAASRAESGGTINVQRHIATRALGWTWWNGAQFGAWIGLGSALLGYATTTNCGGCWQQWAAAVGGIVCYGIAIAGGAAVGARDAAAPNFLRVNGSAGEMVTLEMVPVDLSSVTDHWSLPPNLSWHKVLDDRTANTYLASDGRGHHGIATWPSPTNTKRNSDNDFDEIDGNGDYAYMYLEAGNSAREYYYDHSLSDWENYMPGVEYWLVTDDEDSNTYQQFCMVPQDTQGNAVAAISVQTNFNSYNDALNCATAAEEANGTFDPN